MHSIRVVNGEGEIGEIADVLFPWLMRKKTWKRD